jgi:hypothetical protein
MHNSFRKKTKKQIDFCQIEITSEGQLPFMCEKRAFLCLSEHCKTAFCGKGLSCTSDWVAGRKLLFRDVCFGTGFSSSLSFLGSPFLSHDKESVCSHFLSS